MKPNPVLPNAAPATLQTILDRLAGHAGLSETRKRDLRSAVTSFAKLMGQPPAAIPLDLADIRRTLDSMVPARAQISRKRWANLRSDLAAAIEASGLRPMLKTATSSSMRSGPGFLRLPTGGSAMAFRASPDGRACAGSRQRPSTPARLTASSPSSKGRP